MAVVLVEGDEKLPSILAASNSSTTSGAPTGNSTPVASPTNGVAHDHRVRLMVACLAVVIAVAVAMI